MSTLVNIKKWIDEVLNKASPRDQQNIIAANRAINVQEWLTNASIIIEALKHLQEELVKEKDERTDNKKVLTNVLNKWEQWSGLEANIPTYIGELTLDIFNELSQEGKLFKDLGAARIWDHGEFTHRLQWYVILYQWSNGFTNKTITEEDSTRITPKQFLIKCNQLEIPKEYWTKLIPDNQNLKLWDALFDRIMGSDWLDIKEAWTCPELTNAMLITNFITGHFPSNWIQEEKNIYEDFRRDIKNIAKYDDNVFGQYSEYASLLTEILTDRFKKRATWDNQQDGILTKGARPYIVRKTDKNFRTGKEIYIINENKGVISRNS